MEFNYWYKGVVAEPLLLAFCSEVENYEST